MNGKTETRGKIIGILGGMGPEATVELFKRIIEKTPIHKDQDHLRVIIYNNPVIPDRTQAILHGGESPLFLLKQTAQVLEKAGADCIAIPCNSAHYYLDGISEAIKIPILDMIGKTALAIKEPVIGLMATEGTVRAGLYHHACANRGIEVLTPEETDQEKIMHIIYGIKAGKEKLPLKEMSNGVVKRLQERGAKAVIAGCTELSLVMEQDKMDIPLYDALDILAQAAVNKALSVT